MAKHVDGPTCVACAVKLATGCHEIQEWGLKAKERFHDLHFAWVFRGEADQQACVKAKLSTLNWPNSRHNVMVNGLPSAEAFDAFFLDKGGKAIWPWRRYAELSAWLKEEGAPLDWGYDLWKKDGPHFQVNRVRADNFGEAPAKLSDLH